MKKILTGAGIFAGALILLWIVGRVAGFWGWFKISSPSNEPGVMAGDHVLMTNFKKVERYSFVVYTSSVTDSMSRIPMEENDGKRSNYLHRLCGLPGDIIEMKKGKLFVNGKDFDEAINCKLGFLFPSEKMGLLDEEDFSEEKGDINRYYQGTGDSLILFMDKKLQQKYSQRFPLLPFRQSDTTVFKWYKNNNSWSVDNFGPLQIPADSCFVVGDNRHNSLDSRYTGFVAMKDISGTVINK